MEYYIGQIFEEMYPSEAAEWCNNNNAIMVEIEPSGDVRRFQIQVIPEPTPEEIKQRRIAQLKAELDATDYVVIKIAESDNAEEQAQLREHYAEVIVNRKAWRAEINELESGE